MKVGYARVSTETQDINNQLEVLKNYCDITHSEVCSTRVSIEKRDQVIAALQPGDTLVVTRLDRVSRSLKDLLEIIERIKAKKAGFRCLSQEVLSFSPETTQNSIATLLLNILGAVSQFERDIISERTKEALSIKRKKVLTQPRPCKVNMELLKQIQQLRKEKLPKRHILKILNITGSRYNKYLSYHKRLSKKQPQTK